MNFIKDFLLTPLEPLFFGRPSPFNAGESRNSSSMFPPSPSTFQGIIRSHLLRSVSPQLNLDDWSKSARNERKELVGDSEKLPECWQIKGPLPAKLGEDGIHPWVKVPRFLFDNNKRLERGIFFKSVQPGLNDIGSGNDLSEDYIYTNSPNSDIKPALGWIDSNGLLNALAGKDLSDISLYDIPPFLKTNQSQPGIALNRKKNSAQDSMLYVLEHLRFSSKSGLWGNFNGSLHESMGENPFSKGVAGAGRKSRLASFTSGSTCKSWSEILKGEHLKEADDKSFFWIYLLSPAAMTNKKDDKNPILPGNIEFRLNEIPNRLSLLNSNENSQDGPYIKCITAITDHPMILGGIDMAKGTTKPNNSYLPQGSSWLIEINAEKKLKQEILQELNNSHLLGSEEEARFGFGHVLVGIGPDLA